MTRFVSVLQRPNIVDTGLTIKELDYKTDRDTYRNIFSKTNESTVLSPYSIHYEHYIVATKNDLLADMNSIFMRVPF